MAPSYLVFLPPPSLDAFPCPRIPASDRHRWDTAHVSLAPTTRDQHRTQRPPTSNALASSSVLPSASSRRQGGDRSSVPGLSLTGPPRVLSPSREAVDEIHQQPESEYRPLGAKRVRIRSSPVLVVETPERRSLPQRKPKAGQAPRQPSRLASHSHVLDEITNREASQDCANSDEISSDAEAADKSRVVLGADGGDDGESEDAGSDRGIPPLRDGRAQHAGEDARRSPPQPSTAHSYPNNASNSLAPLSRISRQGSTVCRFSFFSRSGPRGAQVQAPISSAGADASSEPQGSGGTDAARVRSDCAILAEGTADEICVGNKSNLSLGQKAAPAQLRTSARPAAKQHPALDRLRGLESRARSLRTPAVAPPSEASHSLLEDTESQIEVRRPESESSDGEASIGATRSSSSLGLDSIPPPPTLHFALASITPLSRILAQPQAFLQPNAQPVYGARSNMALGGSGGKVNLLVVVKEIGEVSYVNAKYAPDAVARKRGGGGIHDGRTERVEVVVMDGRPDGGDYAMAQHQHQGEKHFFKVILWGSLARQWIVGEEAKQPSIGYADGPPVVAPPRHTRQRGDWSGYSEDRHAVSYGSLRSGGDTTASRTYGDGTTLPNLSEEGESLPPEDSYGGEGPKSTEPRQLRPGDVVFLKQLSIVNTTTIVGAGAGSTMGVGATVGARRSRLGAGFPPRRAGLLTPSAAVAAASAAQPPPCLVAHGSERNATSIELCYRSDIVDLIEDGRCNFDPELARFDNKSRRVWDLHLLWCQGR